MAEPKRPQVRETTVGEDSGGQRIDNFLLKRLKGVPKSRIYRLLRKGEVRVNRRRAKPEYRLQKGDIVRIPPVRTRDPAAAAKPGEWVLKQVEQNILYEDDGLLVLNKPSGLAVHGGSGVSHGVIEALRALRPDARFLELAHRLDRDTSGCLVIAKKRSTLRAFHELMRNGGVDKRYLTLVQGRWRGGKVEAPLRKNILSSGERLVKVHTAGKYALSLFSPVTLYEGASLMEVKLITGRTHQIRVHARHSGHPIAGDDKYGDSEFNRRMAGFGLKRLFLHAGLLHFTLDTTVHVEAPLEEGLKKILKALEGKNVA
ncbi:23S rRNA pseudouridine(955/2504/2580) synthase RluC [Thiohalomonas denitrificans]|uniref:Pseudouridine synthase n=1 Tax=Thiohalomonas denitrificans TaxID=415747 RepID=A0A1G5QBD5_9GAMM|nr:23S rRNA pseudouridine(955/2504/2580) synthase RluC [Thiohalomonas denitrificans]SCZ58896.1 23S rRNA pseudouridine955/2504/2580 synthase [Thiohalomonas denitrificans]